MPLADFVSGLIDDPDLVSGRVTRGDQLQRVRISDFAGSTTRLMRASRSMQSITGGRQTEERPARPVLGKTINQRHGFAPKSNGSIFQQIVAMS
jgi:hypothetical protein